MAISLAPFGYGVALVFGFPIWTLFEMRKWYRAWPSLIAGLVLGPVSMCAIQFIFMRSEANMSLEDLALTSALGALTTGIFWLIVLRQKQTERSGS
jgi:hypothetical protein